MDVYVRLLLTVYERGDRREVRSQATRLLADMPRDFSAALNLLRRLRDVGE